MSRFDYGVDNIPFILAADDGTATVLATCSLEEAMSLASRSHAIGPISGISGGPWDDPVQWSPISLRSHWYDVRDEYPCGCEEPHSWCSDAPGIPIMGWTTRPAITEASNER